jgi:quercetin dioxygenase-like cupin family protein
MSLVLCTGDAAHVAHGLAGRQAAVNGAAGIDRRREICDNASWRVVGRTHMETLAEMEDDMEAKHVFSQKAFNEQKMQKVNLFETERMFCDLYCFEPGQEQKTHTHAGADKIYYVLEGCGTFHIGGESRELQEHTIVIAPADIEHGVVNTSGARLVLLVYMAPKP